MKKISFSLRLLPMLMVLLLTSCNLYMDGDDLNQDDTASGDGFTAPKTVTDSITTITYQFNEGTKFLDARYRPYITRYRTDSLYNQAEIYLRKSIPADLLPQRGNYLSTDLYDIFDEGLVHQVDAVVASGDEFVVKAHHVTVGEVFKTLKVASDFFVALDSTDAANGGGAARAPGARQYGFKLRPVPHSARDGVLRAPVEVDFDRAFISADFLFLPPTYTFTDKLDQLSPKTRGILTKLNGVKNRIDASMVKPFGEFDGGVAASFKAGLKLHFELDKDEELVDFHGWLYRTIDYGIVVREVKGGLSIPLAGWGHKEVKRSNPSVGSSTTKIDDYLLRIKSSDIPVPAGPLKMTVKFQPNIVLDLFASFKPNPDGDGLRFGDHSEGYITEFGFHEDKVNGRYSYPRENTPAASEDDTEDEWDTSFAAGVELHAYLDMICTFYGCMQCTMTPEAALTVGYEKNLNDKYRLDAFTLNSGAKHTPAYGCNSNFYVEGSLRANLNGQLEFGPLWSVNLFDYDTSSFTLKKKWPLYPDFNTMVAYKEQQSTQEASVFDAEVSVGKSYIYSPRESPLLAIYSAPVSNADGPKTFVKMIEPSNATSSVFDAKTKFKYHFTVPGRDTQHVYYAVPVYLTGYGITRQYLYATPAVFFSSYVSLNVSNMEQLRVISDNADSDINIYAFKFNLSGVAPATAKKHLIIINIYDQRNGTLLATKKFSLGQLPKGRLSRDYAFFFTGNRHAYYASATYCVDDGKGPYTDVSTVGGDIVYGGGTEEIEDLRYDFSGTSKYHLLQ